MSNLFKLTIIASIVAISAQAAIVCEEDFSKSDQLDSIGLDGSRIKDPEMLNQAMFTWGPWKGYAPVASQAVFVGSKARTFERPLNARKMNANEEVWFSLTVDLQNSFTLRPLGMSSDEAAKSLHIRFEPDSRIIFGQNGIEAADVCPKLEPTEQYLLIGRYQFLANNRTRLQFAAIPSASKSDLSKPIDFDSPNEGLLISTIESLDQPQRLNAPQISMDSGSLMGNLRVGTEYKDVLGSPVMSAPAITAKPAEKKPAVAAKTSEQSKGTPGYLIAGGGVIAISLLGGLAWAMSRKKSGSGNDDDELHHHGLVHTFAEILHHDPATKEAPEADKEASLDERAKPKFMGEEEEAPATPAPTKAKEGGEHDDDLIPMDWIS